MWKPREIRETVAWEYRVDGARPMDLVAMLARYGDEGWELVDVVPEQFANTMAKDGVGIERPVLVTTLYRAIFKRPKA